MNWKVLGIGAVIIVPLVVVLASGFGHDPRGVSDELEGQTAPMFALQSLAGDTISMESLRGHPVVLNYWATWCAPCVGEHAQFLRAAQAYVPRGVTFLGVLYGDTPDKARAMLAQRGQAYPTLIDPGNRMSIDYGVAGVPETFIIDREGKIVRKYSGPISFQVLAAELEPLL